MHTIWAQQSIPKDVSKPQIFLAGPTLRSRKCFRCLGNGYLIHIPGSIEDPCERCRAVPNYRERSWRELALRYLERVRYDGYVYVPEFEDWREWNDDDKVRFNAQIYWEWDALEAADVIAFWIPRSPLLLGLTTNVEFGFWVPSGKVLLGYPTEAEHMRYLHLLAEAHDVPIVDTMAKLLDTAIVKCQRVVH